LEKRDHSGKNRGKMKEICRLGQPVAKEQRQPSV